MLRADVSGCATGAAAGFGCFGPGFDLPVLRGGVARLVLVEDWTPSTVMLGSVAFGAPHRRSHCPKPPQLRGTLLSQPAGRPCLTPMRPLRQKSRANFGAAADLGISVKYPETEVMRHDVAPDKRRRSHQLQICDASWPRKAQSLQRRDRISSLVSIPLLLSLYTMRPRSASTGPLRRTGRSDVRALVTS